MNRPLSTSTLARHCQRGISLVFSLLALVALSLAAVALIRAVNTGSGILGNLGFKQDTLLGADDATRLAINWLGGKVSGATADLNTDITASGYYAADRPSLNATGSSASTATAMIDWNGKGCGAITAANCLTPAAVDASKLTNKYISAQYVILRLCDQTGDPTVVGSTIRCATPMTATATPSETRNSPTSTNPKRASSAGQSQYYRIVVRAKGTRDTLSFTDTVVHF
jgi:hypothetical protein